MSKISLCHRIRGVAALAGLLMIASVLDAQGPVIPLETRWPVRLYVGELDSPTLAAWHVEARSDGWVVIGVHPTNQDSATRAQLTVEPRELLDWTRRVREEILAHRRPDSTRGWPRRQVRPGLGLGRVHLEALAPNLSSPNPALLMYKCFGNEITSEPTRVELARLLALFESAAKRAGGGAARPPTLLRPYDGSEVSCGAQLTGVNPAIPYPDDVPEPDRTPRQIGFGYIVDTTGQIEAGSIQFLPGTDARFERVVRQTIERWRFLPAEWDGTPVRTFVHETHIAMPTLEIVNGNAIHVIRFEATPGGWVRLDHLADSYGPFIRHEWYTPDAVEAFADRIDSVLANPDSLARARARDDVTLTMGTSLGVEYRVLFPMGKSAPRVSLNGCNEFFYHREAAIDSAQTAAMRAAVHAARALRSTPIDESQTDYEGDEVACDASFPAGGPAALGRFPSWRLPVAYPASLAAVNAQVRVVVSFVIDASGVVDPRSFRGLPGDDPRAVAALPILLRRLRFLPATRGGRPVRQRVIQTFLFEPPVVCRTGTRASVCRRAYSNDLDASRPPRDN